MDELVAWYRQQLDDDERAAKAAGRRRWTSDTQITTTRDDAGVWVLGEDGDPVAVARHAFDESGESVSPHDTGGHIARHDPAAVLADVEAKRAVLELCVTETPDTGGRPLALRTVRLLARAYRHRPGWKTEWEA